ncbi:hypothetical protein OROHE_012801 [Orobanche hederae]
MTNSRQSKKRRGESTSNPPESNRFVNPQTQKIFNEILIDEEVTSSHHFDFDSLNGIGIRLDDFFDMLGINKFVSFCGPIYEELVREFYANFSTNFNADGLVVINSLVRGKPISFDASRLSELFGLQNKGFVCNGNFVSENDSSDEELDDNLNELVVRDHLKSHAVIDVSSNKFENNDFGLNIRLLHDAITRSLMPKVNAQQKLVNIDMEIIYHVLNDLQVNFARVVMKWFVEKGSIFHKNGYVRKDRQRKSGMPFGSVLTGIFEDAGVNFSGLHKLDISKGNMVHEGTIRTMKYVQTRNRGWIYFAYLRDGDSLADGSALPRMENRIFSRGPQAERSRLHILSSQAGPSRVNRPSSSSFSSLLEARVSALEQRVQRSETMLENLCTHFGIALPPHTSQPDID